MCLTIDQNKTGLVQKRFKRSQLQKFYKVVRVVRPLLHDDKFGRLSGVFSICYTYRTGYNIARGSINNKNSDTIEQGALHCYRTKKHALRSWASREKSVVVIPVYVLEKDFIAAGRYDVAVKSLYIRKKDYNKAIVATNKRAVVGR